MNKCVFCNVPELTEITIYHERENFYILLDPNPVSPGHSLIVPKKHVNSIEELDEESFLELKSLIETAKKGLETESLKLKYNEILDDEIDERSVKLVSEALESDFMGEKPSGYNIGVNLGEAAGQTIDHLHIHIIPRYSGDVEDPEGGVRNIFPEKGNYQS